MNPLHRNPFSTTRKSHKMSIVNAFKRIGVEVNRIQQDKQKSHTVYYFRKNSDEIPDISVLKNAFSSLSFGEFKKIEVCDETIRIYVKNRKPKLNVRDY